MLNQMRLNWDELVGLSESGWGEFWVSVVSMVIGVGCEGKIERDRFGWVRVR